MSHNCSLLTLFLLGVFPLITSTFQVLVKNCEAELRTLRVCEYCCRAGWDDISRGELFHNIKPEARVMLGKGFFFLSLHALYNCIDLLTVMLPISNFSLLLLLFHVILSVSCHISHCRSLSAGFCVMLIGVW